MSTATSSRRILGATSIALMTVAATDSLRNLPSMAVYGWSSVAWFLLGTFLFLIPIALVAAELATGWPIAGGVYAWVQEAFGERWGFLAVWCEWAQNIVWFPSILTFIATTIAVAINPDLAANNVFLVVVMLTVFWGLTLINLRGLRASTILERIGVIAGTMIPQALLIIFGLLWVLQGHPSQIPWSPGAMLPEINLSTLPLVATVVLLFAGMELSGYHALETRNPQRDYPRAILTAAALIFTLSMLSTLAIAMVVPVQQLNLAAGLMQAFYAFLEPFGLEGWLPVLALLTALGAMATVTTWMIGPAKGLGVAAQRGNLPPIFSRENRQGVPAQALIIQSSLGSLFSLLILFVPSINTSYWIFSALTTQILATMYMLLFASALRLRYSQPDKPRAYRVPGGKVGIWLAGAAGFLSCGFVLFIGFVPPGNTASGEELRYTVTMLIGYLLFTCPPFIFRALRKQNWKQPALEHEST